MDFNTILVITVDGGLVLFFLYALYTIRSPNLASRGIKKDLEVSAQEPVVTPLRGTNEEKYEIPKFDSRELFELEKEEPAPREYGLSEYKPEPAEPTTGEFELPVFEPEPMEISPREYGISEFEPKPSSAKAQEDKSKRTKKA
jgi:hypothetical protein